MQRNYGYTITKQVIVLSNGSQGGEIIEICRTSGINIIELPMDLKLLQDTLLKADDVCGVVTIHCEWLSGLVNPVNKIGEIVRKLSPGESKAFMIKVT